MLEKATINYIQKASPELREVLIAIAKAAPNVWPGNNSGEQSHPAVSAVLALQDGDACRELLLEALGGTASKRGRPRGSRNKAKAED